MSRQPPSPPSFFEFTQLIDAIAGASNEAEIHAITVSILRSVFGTQRVAVLLLDCGAEMRSVAEARLSAPLRELALDPRAWGIEATELAPHLFENAMEHPALEGHRELLRSENIGAAAFIPVYFGSRLMGQLVAFDERPREFRPDELSGARALAAQVGFALEHRRMNRALQNAHDELAVKLEKEREARMRVHDSEGRLRLALDAGQMGTWEWNIETGEVVWSPELQVIHGLVPGTFPGTFEAFKSDIHPDDVDRVLQTIQSTLASQDSNYRVEYRLITPDGELRWIEARGRILRHETGEPRRLLGICCNITERKQREQAQDFLQEAAAILSATLDPEETLRNIAQLAVPRMADWCTVHLETASGDIEVVEAAHSSDEKKLGPEVYGVWQIHRDSDATIAEVLRTAEPRLFERITVELLEQRARSPEHLEVLRRLSPRSAMVLPLRVGSRAFGVLTLMSSESGRHYGPADLQVAQQLADRAALAVENSRLYDQATRAVEAREEMLAAVSHDLRNPINTIVTACALQDLPIPPEKKKRALDSIRRATKSMESLIQDLLDVSRIDAGRLSVECEPVDVSTLIAESVTLFSPLAEHASIRLVQRVEEDLPVLPADRERLMQVLSNLVGNALKFVDPGGVIEICAEKREQALAISVRDNGVGISEEQLPHLFDRFWQAKGQGRMGTGLGLAITKGIVDSHRGTIDVESTPGSGSRFTVTLPLTAAGATSTAA